MYGEDILLYERW
jgi:hypothetical protein